MWLGFALIRANGSVLLPGELGDMTSLALTPCASFFPVGSGTAFIGDDCRLLQCIDMHLEIYVNLYPLLTLKSGILLFISSI